MNKMYEKQSSDQFGKYRTNVKQFPSDPQKDKIQKCVVMWKQNLLIGFVTMELLFIALAFQLLYFLLRFLAIYVIVSDAHFLWYNIQFIELCTCLRYLTFLAIFYLSLSFHWFAGWCKAFLKFIVIGEWLEFIMPLYRPPSFNIVPISNIMYR